MIKLPPYYSMGFTWTPPNQEETKDAVGIVVRCSYARVFHDLMPQVIFATRSLIQLDKRAHMDEVVITIFTTNSSSNAYTLCKAKKPKILFVLK